MSESDGLWVLCLPVTREPHVASIRKQGSCGHEVWVSASAAPRFPVGADYICLDCANVSPDTEVELPDYVLAEIARYMKQRGQES